MKRLILIFIPVLFIWSCKKDTTDTKPPVISILSPYANQLYNVNDTILISANVTDETQLTSVYVSLENAQLSQVEPAVNIHVTSRNMGFSQRYELSDQHLLSGIYYVVVTANDGYNLISGFQKISITASPRKRTGIYVLTQPYNPDINVLKIDSNFQVSQQFSTISDYSGSAINSYYQQLTIAGSYTGHLNAFNLSTNSSQWSHPSGSGSTPYFEGIYNDDTLSYVPLYNGQIKGYDNNGMQNFSAAADPNFYGTQLFKQNGKLFVEEKYITGSPINLVTFYCPFGANYQEALMPCDAVAICPKDYNDLLIFGNNASGQGVMEMFTINSNTFYSPQTLPSGKILSAVAIDSDDWLIGCDNNTVYKYQYSNNSLTSFIPSIRAYHLLYDDVNNQIIVASKNTVSEYTYVTIPTLVNTVNTTDSIINIHLLFNK
ncbi:MAG TPA: Ig-like domain-containing protein [Bacteroidia bacterium]|nr:Ig-like domain-containing protein [Bacteroidia bacterium]